METPVDADADDSAPVVRRAVTIVNAYGLHMRPSTRFVKLAGTFRSDVWVDFRGTRANGKSLLEMTCLGAEHGTTLEIEAKGPDAEQAVAALAELVAAGFHMDDEVG